jgi:hypothetical protein
VGETERGGKANIYIYTVFVGCLTLLYASQTRQRSGRDLSFASQTMGQIRKTPQLGQPVFWLGFETITSRIRVQSITDTPKWERNTKEKDRNQKKGRE